MPVPTVYVVIPRSGIDIVGALARDDDVVASTTINGIISVATRKNIIPAQTAKPIIAIQPQGDIVSGSSRPHIVERIPHVVRSAERWRRSVLNRECSCSQVGRNRIARVGLDDYPECLVSLRHRISLDAHGECLARIARCKDHRDVQPADIVVVIVAAMRLRRADIDRLGTKIAAAAGDGETDGDIALGHVPRGGRDGPGRAIAD